MMILRYIKHQYSQEKGPAIMTKAWQQEGRVNQKRRTRAAILTAAVELLEQGQSPAVAEVADAALVSRATAYRYFPTQEYLLFEAALESTRSDIDRELDENKPPEDPEARTKRSLFVDDPFLKGIDQ